MLLSQIFSGTLVLLLAPLVTAVPLVSEAKIVPRSDYRLYVGNLSFHTTKEGLSHLLSQSGHVVDVSMVTDRETGKFRGFAFVTMGSPAEASQAISHWDGHNVDGRPLKVKICEPRICPRK